MIAAPVGEAEGIYKKHNLNVKLTGNGKVPEAMAAGKMDAGYIGARGLVGANAKGSPIVYAANNHTGGSMYLVASNDIKDPKEIIGQKVAIGSPSKGEGWLCGYSKILDLPTEDDKYDLITMDSDSDKYLALKTGQIKAYTCCDPWGSMAEYEGTGHILATYTEMDDEMGICCGFALNKNFVKENRELAKELLRAHVDSIEYIYENPKQAAEVFSKYFNVPYDVSLMTIYKKCVSEGRTLTWNFNEKEFDHALKVYKEFNLLEKIPKKEEVVAEDIYKEANLPDFNKFIKEKVDNKYPVGMSFEEFKKKAEAN